MALDWISPHLDFTLPDQRCIEERREELKRAIIDLLEAVSGEQPLLIAVDDAHLLDDPSRAVLHAFAQGMNSAAVLVVLLCRPRLDGHTLIAHISRFASYSLPPLSKGDSRALVRELATPQESSESEVAQSVAQAAGNPFYLHALARHPCDAVELPVHIRSLAQTLYLSLGADARTLLDASLLLDTLASTNRVIQVASVQDSALLPALRELEACDVLRSDCGVFVGPHAILRETLDAMMPTTSRTVLHRRIATLLAAECDNGTSDHAIAWAAVTSWLAAGEADAAAALALHLARNTATLGEPEAGALLLDRLYRCRLPLGVQRKVLDEIIGLAEAGLCAELLEKALKERTTLAVAANEGRSVLAALILRSVSAEIVAGRPCDITPLERIISDPLIAPLLRVTALARLLGIADLLLDRTLAETTYAHSLQLASSLSPCAPVLLRTSLVYHTSFGDITRVPDLIDRILSLHDVPSLDAECSKSRTYCMLSLVKIGRYGECAALAQREWEFMDQAGHLFAAEYAGAVMIEALVADGNARGGRSMLDALQTARARRPHAGSMHSPVYYSSVVALALLEGDLEAARANLPHLGPSVAKVGLPRLRTVELSLTLLVDHASGDLRPSRADVAELEALFSAGRGLGGLDVAAEALWHCYLQLGDAARASEMLSGYLRDRREIGRPEASLRKSTARDPVWLSQLPPAT